jgi:myo-inositol-1(or 4)-monophosphatase
MDYERILNLAIAAAYKGGEQQRNLLGKLESVDKKGAIDLVTEADTAAEAAILETITAIFPDHAVLAEESGRREGDSDHRWIIDPLDGTTNFAHGVPVFCTSIAFSHKGELAVGAVLNPVSGELFADGRERGAQLNGRAIGVSDRHPLSECLLVTGFPYNFKERFDTFITRFGNCLRASRGVRRLGAAALDLCFVACGRFDAFWEENLHPWDTAAGALIAAEAGAEVTDFRGEPFTVDKKEILATNSRIHREMIEQL